MIVLYCKLKTTAMMSLLEYYSTGNKYILIKKLSLKQKCFLQDTITFVFLGKIGEIVEARVLSIKLPSKCIGFNVKQNVQSEKDKSLLE